MQLGNLNLLNTVSVLGGLCVGKGAYEFPDAEKREQAYVLIGFGTLCAIFGTQVSLTINHFPTCVQPFLLQNVSQFLRLSGPLLAYMGIEHLRYAAQGADQIRKNLGIGAASTLIGGAALYIGFTSTV